MKVAKENHRISRLQKLAAVSLWVSFFGAVLVYFLFGWLNVWRPHVGWWWLTTCLVVFSAAASFVLMLLQLPGEERIRAIGVFLIATVPLAWFAAFLWSTIIAIDTREDMKLSTPIRSLGLWVGSYFELEARWRYPRITEGKHVQLFDDGTTSNVEQMVADMDRHIEEMAETLESPIPATKVRWVRGSLFGQSGRAVGAWAICDSDENKLDYLDKHEVAHCVITMMCPVSQEMPMLLCEGWAQSQSSYKPTAILELLAEKESDGALTLNEIIANSYGRSIGPAYRYGGPFASYLVERFGGTKFVELYGGVRRASFKRDVQRVLGVSWDQLETDFWTWLASRREWAKKTGNSEAESSMFVFERPGDTERWKEILETVKSAEASFNYPDSAAFEVRRKGDRWTETSRIVISNDCVWATHDESSTSRSIRRFQIATPECCGHFVDQNGTIEKSDQYVSSNAKQEADYLKTFWFRRNSLSSVMMIDLTNMSGDDDRQYLIQKIEPLPDSDLLEFCFSEIYESRPASNRVVEAIIDRTRNFDVVKIPSDSERDSTRKHVFQFGLINNIDVLTSWTSISEKGEKFSSKLIELSAVEAETLRAEVESVVSTADIAKRVIGSEVSRPNLATALAQWLINPIALAIAWPALGVILLAVDVFCDRFRWKVNRK